MAPEGRLANFAKRITLRSKETIMATMNVSLPDQMKEWVEAQSADGRYANASDYVRDLIRKDRERSRLAELQKVVDHALASGISTRTPEELREWVRQRAEAALSDDVASNERRRG
jgi:antitoxin ParD1/3/4